MPLSNFTHVLSRSPPGALLLESTRAFMIYGANTEVGKTVFSTILCRNLTRPGPRNRNVVAYLKPVSTGPDKESDEKYFRTYAPKADYVTTLHQYKKAVSPHLAALESGLPVVTDGQIQSEIAREAYKYDRARTQQRSEGWLFVETAGGVHSPGPSGTTQADLYAPLRLPVILVGDSKLGGISQTISAFESLRIRGYDVVSVLLLENERYQNHIYLEEYFRDQHSIKVTCLPHPPAFDHSDILAYYKQVEGLDLVDNLVLYLNEGHISRLRRLDTMGESALSSIWYPFTQHANLTPDKITVIDSARGDYFQTWKSNQPLTERHGALQPTFDASASWWTQGLGHGNPTLALEAAYAAGRYGHVMFPEAIHEPALALAESMIRTMENPRLERVFFSDNGSTGVEVAIKMALRATRRRYGWGPDEKLSILGLKNSYHGDTIGAMDATEPSPFNTEIEWYEGKGVWLEYPTVICSDGQWKIEIPKSFSDVISSSPAQSPEEREIPISTSSLFDVNSRRESSESELYERYILNCLIKCQKEGIKFGALLLEPVVLGAGGMALVDPLFQQTLVNFVRKHNHLFWQPRPEHMTYLNPPLPENDWLGLPVIFDEVFTGMYRLGRFSAASFLQVDPDISVHAKLLTGGLIPLCVTMASDSIFQAFKGTDKTTALLHGHSYTAHPVGCQVALKSVQTMLKMDKEGADWNWAKENWDHHCWSVWEKSFVEALSKDNSVEGAWALGSVLAVHMKTTTAGYTSNSANRIQAALREGYGDGEWGVHSRVLGNVLYFMTGLTTTEDTVKRMQDILMYALNKE
ncbi:bifunctional dethiobiotin synthetase/7 8-diamino-pelargonic acid aminotransferase [Naviculisporaceae sp. PSN 640]